MIQDTPADMIWIITIIMKTALPGYLSWVPYSGAVIGGVWNPCLPTFLFLPRSLSLVSLSLRPWKYGQRKMEKGPEKLFKPVASGEKKKQKRLGGRGVDLAGLEQCSFTGLIPLFFFGEKTAIAEWKKTR